MGSELVNEVRGLREKLEKGVEELSCRGMRRAETDRAYRIALSQKLLTLKAEGVPMTIISDIARGDEAIAKLRFERDATETFYTAALENIHSIKLQIRVVENQIGREWHSG